MTLLMRYMQLADIQQVVDIDRQAFPMPWSARSYAYEVAESSYSHMVVVEREVERPVQGWRRFVHQLRGDDEVTEVAHQVIGYGGLWNIMEEAHISTIATLPELRGQGIGELLLAAMIRRSITLNAGYVVLEVRVSNTVAQNLYRKYEFEVVSTKPDYYRDNNEDAYDMRLELTKPDFIERFNERFVKLMARIDVQDWYSDAVNPHERL